MLELLGLLPKWVAAQVRKVGGAGSLKWRHFSQVLVTVGGNETQALMWAFDIFLTYILVISQIAME